jgi:LAS superfamily LD-carboxypeptidase LdcB
LCLIGIGAHVLRCDAAAAFGALALAAVPGTSNHGWGLALDLCGGAQSFGSAQYAWLAAIAPAFGWVNPPWARPGAGREEPWHWEYSR